MAPSIRKELLKLEESKKKSAKRAGVMALFYPDANAQTKLLLILRKTYAGVHSNQIGFPGGKVEPDDQDMEDTALRETHEEVGVLPGSVEVIKTLSEVYIPPSNFVVQPFMGVYAKPRPFVIQESEVEAAVEVFLKDFLDNSNLIEENLTTSYAKNFSVPAYRLNGYTVWGATAMIMSEIKELLEQVL